MGFYPSARVMLGFEISKSDLFTETELETKCGTGHTPPSKRYKFCPECGSEFATRKGQVPTEELSLLGEVLGLDAIEEIGDLKKNGQAGWRKLVTPALVP